MVLQMRKWRASLLSASLAPRGSLVLGYRRGKRTAQLWRTSPKSSTWVIQLIDSRGIVLSAHRWQDARQIACRHVRMEKKRKPKTATRSKPC